LAWRAVGAACQRSDMWRRHPTSSATASGWAVPSGHAAPRAPQDRRARLRCRAARSAIRLSLRILAAHRCVFWCLPASDRARHYSPDGSRPPTYRSPQRDMRPIASPRTAARARASRAPDQPPSAPAALSESASPSTSA
jgi:hypothetical protein